MPASPPPPPLEVITGSNSSPPRGNITVSTYLKRPQELFPSKKRCHIGFSLAGPVAAQYTVGYPSPLLPRLRICLIQYLKMSQEIKPIKMLSKCFVRRRWSAIRIQYGQHNMLLKSGRKGRFSEMMTLEIFARS